MKKLLILILIITLSSTLLLSACAPDEPETLYGKPKLSQLPDEEILELMSQLKLSKEYNEEDIPRIKSLTAVMEDDESHFFVLDSFNMTDLMVLFAYYYNYDYGFDSFDINQYIKYKEIKYEKDHYFNPCPRALVCAFALCLRAG